MKVRWISIAPVLLTGFLIMTVCMGCSKDALKPEATGPVSTDPEAPGLPPVASMQFNFGLFDAQTAVGMPLEEAEFSAASESRWNWFNAAIRVAILNLVVAEVVVPPSVAFFAALHTIPSYIGDNTFMWVYTWFENPHHEIEIRLRGTLLDDEIDWEMQISDDQANPPLDQATWFSGRSHIVEDRGYWILNNLENGEAAPAIRIDWKVEAEDQKELSLEVIEAGNEIFGDTLSYLQEGVIVTVAFYDASENVTADMTWNEETGAGSLQAPDYNGGERACWDENLIDAECPADDPS
ncbi:MAG: hypothetical protein KJ970_07975 [Candidatus Eisenbacteria bacterium]|uniref:Uncharacterized protein n=1 Tax=Eiseniibacteriota bacterium TaxID=2212470 RepID=A0A948RWB9_UNCEI|nr:hypothetical protein [Candidatus Eisenbacteria bacterium]MBU1947453.1 hypothetical protein [Candidatus Eisenbacteria bacterium]MBU2690854.1 hypothetical protein [Candidatus Eisenbacteria bacterium]